MFFSSQFLNLLRNMAACKIVLLFIIFQLVNCKPSPLKEFHIKKKFEFKFKPPPHRPFTFIKEKCTKLGHFAFKHVIMKRSPFELAQIPEQKEPDTIFKVSLEKSLEAGSPVPLITSLPPPIVTPNPPLFTPKPVPISVPPPTVTILPPIRAPLSRLPVEEIIIVTPIPPPPPPPVSIPPPPPPPVIVPTPILPASPPPVPVPGPPIPVSPIPLPPPVPKNVVQGNLLTDIARVDEINAYLKAVEALSPPPVEPLFQGNILPVVTGNSIEAEVKVPVVEEKPGPLVKGSRLALYFGNILLQVMSEVISSARSAISQYSQPAPF